MNKCNICGEVREGTTITLTDKEKEYITKLSGEPATETIFYCNPCGNILKSKEHGRKYITGFFRVFFNNLNYSEAENVMFQINKAIKKTSE